MQSVEIVHVIRQIKQGFTEPWLCRCDDNNLYVVKGSNASRKELAAELLCAQLCNRFGLPIPECRLVWVPQAIVNSGAYPGLEIECCFGSMFVSNLTEMVFSKVSSLDSQIMRDLYIFDFWIKNADRTLTKLGGNPNSFIDVHKSSPVVFDHNQAFDLGFDINVFKETHLATSFWNSKQARLDDRARYSEKFDEVLGHWPQIAATLPLDWFDDEDTRSGFVEHVRLLLASYEHDNFWEGLK